MEKVLGWHELVALEVVCGPVAACIGLADVKRMHRVVKRVHEALGEVTDEFKERPDDERLRMADVVAALAYVLAQVVTIVHNEVSKHMSQVNPQADVH